MKPNIGRTIVGGLSGTVAITLMMYFVSPMMGVKMDIAASLGKMLGRSWGLGMTDALYQWHDRLPADLYVLTVSDSAGLGLGKRCLLGLILWFLAQAVVMPMMGGGFFSANMGGMKAVIGSLLGHVGMVVS